MRSILSEWYFDVGHNVPLRNLFEMNEANSQAISMINVLSYYFIVSCSSYEVISGIANFFLDKTKHRPKIGIICGSGLGSLAESLENADVFPYHTIPNFPVSTVEVCNLSACNFALPKVTKL